MQRLKLVLQKQETNIVFPNNFRKLSEKKIKLVVVVSYYPIPLYPTTLEKTIASSNLFTHHVRRQDHL